MKPINSSLGRKAKARPKESARAKRRRAIVIHLPSTLRA